MPVKHPSYLLAATLLTVALLYLALRGPIPTEENGAAPHPPEWRLLNSFGIGEGVYANALLFEKGNNLLWVATSVGVLAIDLDKQAPLHIFTQADGLPNSNTLSLHIDSDGNKWFGTISGAIRYRDGAWQAVKDPDGLCGNTITAIGSQPDGGVLLACERSVARYHTDENTLSRLTKSDPDALIYALAVDSSGTVWVGTEKGPYQLSGEGWVNPLAPDLPDKAEATTPTSLGRDPTPGQPLTNGSDLEQPYVVDIKEDKTDGLWFGSINGGLGRYSKKQWSGYTVNHGLSGASIYDIAEDSEGRLWFATDNGITLLDTTGQWRRLGDESGLPNGHYYAIAATDDGRIWAGTLGAVVQIGPPPRQHPQR